MQASKLARLFFIGSGSERHMPAGLGKTTYPSMLGGLPFPSAGLRCLLHLDYTSQEHVGSPTRRGGVDPSGAVPSGRCSSLLHSGFPTTMRAGGRAGRCLQLFAGTVGWRRLLLLLRGPCLNPSEVAAMSGPAGTVAAADSSGQRMVWVDLEVRRVWHPVHRVPERGIP